MTLALIDSHCHLDDDRFDKDRAQVIQRAQDLGIYKFVIPATTARRWPKVKQISDDTQGVFASYGLHPMFMGEHGPDDIAALDSWLDDHPAVAVGECGLDFYASVNDKDEQLELFRAQLNIAVNHDLPVIIHARKALDTITHEIRLSRITSGVIHSFSGSLQQAQTLVDLGFKLGIAATLSFERAKKLRQVVREIDINALMIETDAPDQSGAQHRGHRNEPAFILDHLQIMSQLRAIPEEELANHLNANCQQIFNLT